MNQFALTQRQKAIAKAVFWVVAVLTGATALIIVADISVKDISEKISGITLVLCLCGISAVSGARIMKKSSDRHLLGAITFYAALIAFTLVFICILIEPENGSSIRKFAFVFCMACAALGYICGISGIRETAASVYYLKLLAICCVAVLGLYFIIQFLGSDNGLEGLEYMFSGSILMASKLLPMTFLLAVTFTCLAKVTSMLHYEGEVEHDETDYQS
jgi:predicted MFS family arabinose efflux permease